VTVVNSGPAIRFAASVEEAVKELSGLGPDGEVMAGATWVMRAPLRGEPFKTSYVALGRIKELTRIDVGEGALIGACVTHAQLANLHGGTGPLGAVCEAARRSAFPAIRNVATIAGNICARPFPEADLVPALIAAGASIELTTDSGSRWMTISDYLAVHDGDSTALITGVHVPTPSGRRSTYERLTVRGGGEYPIASVALSLDMDDDVVRDARVSFGSVEEVARPCEPSEELLKGRRLDLQLAERAGGEAVAYLKARDGLDAPGWYRLAVLPALMKRAVARLLQGT
jgi:aerobic carbon-monoxide dehydrogenase medium subunit